MTHGTKSGPMWRNQDTLNMGHLLTVTHSYNQELINGGKEAMWNLWCEPIEGTHNRFYL